MYSLSVHIDAPTLRCADCGGPFKGDPHANTNPTACQHVPGNYHIDAACSIGGPSLSDDLYLNKLC